MQMDTSKPQKVKTRKTKVITRRSTAQILSSLFFRAIEISVVVVTIAKLLYQLVITFDNSEEHFQGLAAILTNRHVVFVVGNAIVIALLAKSGQFPNQESDTRSTCNGFYDEFVRESRREERSSLCIDETKNRAKQNIAESNGTTANRERQDITGNKGKQSTTVTRQRHGGSENRPKERVVEIESSTEIKGKQSIIESRQKQSTVENRPRQYTGENMAKQSKRSYARSWSENLENPKISRGNLRRSGTEGSLKRFDSVEETRDLNDPMSNDELRYKIESFIARQRRNQKDEEFCIS